MYQYKIIGPFILAVLSVGIRCQSGEDRDSISDILIPPRPIVHHRWPTHDYFHRPTSSCDTETQHALDEIKLEIQDLQQILVGLRQKVDPDFKLPPPRKFCFEFMASLTVAPNYW